MDSADFAKSTLFVYSAAIAHRPSKIYLGITVDLDGWTLTAGTYRATTELSLGLNKVVALDGNGDANSKLLFQAGTTLITGVGAKVVLVGGPKRRTSYGLSTLPPPLGTTVKFKAPFWPELPSRSHLIRKYTVVPSPSMTTVTLPAYANVHLPP
jgi:hypothetical protein